MTPHKLVATFGGILRVGLRLEIQDFLSSVVNYIIFISTSYPMDSLHQS